jgi:uncharacterized damage-inducible protein DinB
MDQRTEPDHAGGETETLSAFLDFQRQTMELKVEGLTRDQLIARHVDSKTTLLGLIKHLIDVERWWFTAVFAGKLDVPYFWERNGEFDSEFDIDDSDEVQAILSLYRDECERSRVVVASAASLDEVARKPDRDHTLRWILVHMIEETARHVGHADILRELTDGAVGE